jgi:DNA-binding LacI/PurR family transcriptional regulator
VQWLPPEGFRLVSEVLDSGAEVDALLCFNDRLAMGAYQALQERGVRARRRLGAHSRQRRSPAGCGRD